MQMKKCPVCQRNYADDNLAFCLEDGAALIAASADSAQYPSAITQPSPRVKYNQEPTLRVPPITFSDATQTLPAPAAKTGKLWIILGLAGLVLLIAICAAAAFIVLKINNSATVSNISNVPNSNSNLNQNREIFAVTPLPDSTPTAADLVGTWKTTVVENKISQEITVSLDSNGKTSYIFKVKNGQTSKDVGSWRFSDGVLYENYSGGASGKSSIKWIDKDHIDLTIIDNGVPAYTGIVRHYTRVK